MASGHEGVAREPPSVPFWSEKAKQRGKQNEMTYDSSATAFFSKTSFETSWQAASSISKG